MKAIMLFCINAYRKYLSPIKAPCCRFYPTCSAYAAEAIASYGALRGGLLAFVRILKCHPFHPGGYDPVPGLSDDNSFRPGSCAGSTRIPYQTALLQLNGRKPK